MAAIAVDVGTSMIKAVVFDDTGAEVAVARQETVVSRPRPGWAEQDMLAVWHAVVFCVRQVASAAEPVRFLAVTAQGDGCWLVDDSGRPTGPAVLWSDGRATEVVRRWQHDGVLERAFRANGSLTFAGLPNAIVTWFGEHDPDRLARSATALYCGGWLHLRLTGRLAVDESDAAAPFLDPSGRTYSDELIGLFGFDRHARLLPPVRPDDQRCAPLSDEAAAALGLPAGLPVVLAPYDVVSTAIGSGATEPGQACTILGTTLCTEVVRAAPDTGGTPAGLTIPVGPGTGVLRAFPTLAGTEVVHWARGLLGVDTPEQLGELAGWAEPGAGGVTFLPYLSPAGERAPFLEPAARGVLFGLSLEHGADVVARAVFEGLSLVIADCLAAAGTGVRELRCCGGGAASDAWCGLIADVTGVPVHRSADTEVGAKGAFLVGLVATGAEPDLAGAARRHVSERSVHLPDPDRAAFYREHYRRFVALRETVAPAWRQDGDTHD